MARWLPHPPGQLGRLLACHGQPFHSRQYFGQPGGVCLLSRPYEKASFHGGPLGMSWKRKGTESACKPGSVPRVPKGAGDDHSSRAPVARRLKRPTRRHRAGSPDRASLFGLAPGGVCRAPGVAARAGELLPHRFTLTAGPQRGPEAVYSLWHFPWGRPPWPLASTLPCGARTFLPFYD